MCVLAAVDSLFTLATFSLSCQNISAHVTSFVYPTHPLPIIWRLHNVYEFQTRSGEPKRYSRPQLEVKSLSETVSTL